MTQEHWGVLGGGVLGMTLALRLREQGKRVTLVEAASGFGGVACAWSLGDVVWDRHYHVILMSDSRLLALLQELGLDEELCWRQSRTGFFVDSKLYSMSNAFEFLRFPPLSLVDKVRLAGTIVHASRIRDWQPLEQVLAVDWLRRWSGRRTVDKIWLPLLRAKMGENATRVSAAFIWAIIARMYAARRAGIKKEMFGYVRGGYARILSAFTEHLTHAGVELRPGKPVRRVEALDGGGVGVQLEDGSRQRFDQVALTMPSSVAAKICTSLTADELRRLNGIEYQGIICASVLMRKPLAGFYITNITDSWVPFTAVIEMSALVDPAQLNGHSLIYLPKYVPAGSPDFQLSDDELQRRFLGALRRMYPGFSEDQVACFRVSRVRYLLPIATLNYSASLPPMTTSLPGIHIVNSAHIVNGTLNVNETIQLAERAAAQIGAQPRSEHTRGESEHEPVETHRQFVP